MSQILWMTGSSWFVNWVINYTFKYVTVYRKTRHNVAPFEKFFLHLQSCRRPDIELSKFYRRSLSRSRYNRPNRSLSSAWNNTFLRNRSIFSRYLRTPRCARFSCRRSHIISHCKVYLAEFVFNVSDLLKRTNVNIVFALWFRGLLWFIAILQVCMESQ